MIKEVLDVMIELAEEHMTMICVTHEMGFARTVADTVVFMDKGQVVEVAPPAEFFAQPKNERTKLFLSQLLKHLQRSSAPRRSGEEGWGGEGSLGPRKPLGLGDLLRRPVHKADLIQERRQAAASSAPSCARRDRSGSGSPAAFPARAASGPAPAIAAQNAPAGSRYSGRTG